MLIALAALAALLTLTAGFALCETADVILPKAAQDGLPCPVVYVLPEDGASAAPEAVRTAVEQAVADGGLRDMIFAFPAFSSAEAAREELAAFAAQIDAAYPTIPDAQHRALVGGGIGGELALRLVWLDDEGRVREEPETFAAAVCHDGSFTADANPLAAEEGLLYETMNEAIGPSSAFVGNFYTFIDANAGNPQTQADGGMESFARMFRTCGAASEDYAVFEYAILMPEHYGAWTDRLRASLAGLDTYFYGAPETEAVEDVHVDETIPEGDERRLDLMGDWYFCAYKDVRAGAHPLDDVRALEDTDYTAWGVVQPGTGWWDERFDASLNGNDSFAGYAWYVRTFDVPEAFGCDGLTLDAGMFDEADEIFINGVRIGSTGFTEQGAYDGSNPWDVERIYALPDGLLTPGENEIAVRMCNSTGGGGWYTGPILIYANTSSVARTEPRMVEITVPSEALHQDVTCHIYLPEGYDAGDDRYPVTYMLHGYGSTGKSFEIAGIPALLDEAVENAELPPSILVCPDDPTKGSFWTGAYGDMVTDDVIPYIDAHYRTIADREHRGIAGESMGGGGAYRLLFDNPDTFSWIFDIYGALEYAGAMPGMMRLPTERMEGLKQYFIAGSHDMYTFDLQHINWDAYLTRIGVEHRFEINHGGHSSEFYLPYVKEAFAYCLPTE